MNLSRSSGAQICLEVMGIYAPSSSFQPKFVGSLGICFSDFQTKHWKWARRLCSADELSVGGNLLGSITPFADISWNFANLRQFEMKYLINISLLTWGCSMYRLVYPHRYWWWFLHQLFSHCRHLPYHSDKFLPYSSMSSFLHKNRKIIAKTENLLLNILRIFGFPCPKMAEVVLHPLKAWTNGRTDFKSGDRVSLQCRIFHDFIDTSDFSMISFSSAFQWYSSRTAMSVSSAMT